MDDGWADWLGETGDASVDGGTGDRLVGAGRDDGWAEGWVDRRMTCTWVKMHCWRVGREMDDAGEGREGGGVR